MQPPWPSARSQLTPSVWGSVACQPPVGHLGLLHHLREHATLFKPLLNPVLDYSPLRSVALFHSRKHLTVRGRPPPQEKRIPANKHTSRPRRQTDTKLDFLIPPVTETALNESHQQEFAQQNSYATSETIRHAQNEHAATSKGSATGKDIRFLKGFSTNMMIVIVRLWKQRCL